MKKKTNCANCLDKSLKFKMTFKKALPSNTACLSDAQFSFLWLLILQLVIEGFERSMTLDKVFVPVV